MVTLYTSTSENKIRQQAFRIVLEAVSRPGKMCQLPETVRCCERFSYLFMVLDLLLDHEVGHFVIEEDGAGHLAQRLYAATKSPPVFLEDADFIIAPYGSTKGSLQRVKRGWPEYPDLGATVVYVVDAISQVHQASIQCSLRGPGIADRVSLPAMEGFDHREILKLSAVNQEFPLGIEALFIDPMGRLMAITRSTQIHIKDAPWHTSL